MPNLPTPIVFIHRGLSSYLWCSLWQCHQRNPDSEIVLIGDRDPHLSFVTFEPISIHDHAATPFRDVYVHASTNPLAFERFCFERWFLLESFVRNNGIGRLVHADSDLMFFCEISQSFPRLGGASFATGRVGAASGHLMLIQDPEMLRAFCRFLMDMYLNPELFNEFYVIYLRHRATGAAGGLCDMSALTMFAERGLATHHELNQIYEGGIFDQSLSDSRLHNREEPFHVESGRKVIVSKSGNAYFEGFDSTLIRALTIHFQGSAKSLIRKYTESPSLRIRAEYRVARLRERVLEALGFASIMRRHYAGGLAKRLRRLLFARRRRAR